MVQSANKRVVRDGQPLAENPLLAEGVPSALVLGGRGLLGLALVNELVRRGYAVHTLERVRGNDIPTVFSAEELTGRILTLRPDVVFNAVAWTQIPEAEANPDGAMAVNCALPALLGRVVRETGTRLVHYSTSFVFDGLKESPYTEQDVPNPVNVYGKSKLAGERALLELGLPGCLVIRGAWLFGPGKENLVSRILGDARQKKSLSMAHDFVGSPTYTPDLAFASVELVQRKASGLYHFANAGHASLCEFAAEAVRLGNRMTTITAHTSMEQPPRVARPPYSVLDASRYTALTGLTPRSWLQALREFVFSDFLDAE